MAILTFYSVSLEFQSVLTSRSVADWKRYTQHEHSGHSGRKSPSARLRTILLLFRLLCRITNSFTYASSERLTLGLTFAMLSNRGGGPKGTDNVLKRAKLRDSSIVCLILIVQTALPILLMHLQPEANKFKNDSVALCSELCIYISFPLLLFSGVGLTILSRVGADIDDDLVTQLSHTSEQIQRLQYCHGSLASAACFQSVAGLIWLLEARQHSNSLALILLTTASSALLLVLAFHVVGVMRVIERMKTPVGGGELESEKQPTCKSSTHLQIEKNLS